MKKVLAFVVAFLISVFVLPSVIGLIGNNDIKKEGDAITTGSFNAPFNISVYSVSNNEISEVELEEYIVGVLAGEMSPTFDIEALKAQAVAARSFILSKAVDYYSGKASTEHQGAMVCTDYKHCKAWQDITDVKNKWDNRFADDYEAKIRKAVNDTSGEYMIYDNKVVKAYFYAISGGRTENCEDVWGASIPYLKSVPSLEDVTADGYESRSTYTKNMFLQKLKDIKNDFNGDKIEIGDINRTEGGGVSKIIINEISFDGKEIRDVFELRSTNFEIEVDDEKVIFNVKGYGHGVGMSQNGANEMALKGKKYNEILKHYYSGVSIVNLYKNL